MKFLLFIAITLLLAYCRFQMPVGGPDLLVVWLITLAFYTESKLGTLQACWIGILHSFPQSEPFTPMICVLTFIVLQHQRFHLGRDCFLPRFITVVSLCALFNFTEWWQLPNASRPNLSASFQLIGIHAAITAIFGILVLNFGQCLEGPLGFRQKRYDF